ncbi:MAG: CrcB protein [Planctomycetota bacterium]|jgi:CrcB protein
MPVQTTVVMAVAAAGALGAASRYLLVFGLRQVWTGSPWPIAVVNVVGCFGFGVCWALAQGALVPERIASPIATAVLVGFFGAFTTFSAFALDGQLLLSERKFGLFAVNMLVQNGLGILALWLGMLSGGARS